ncbi:MULTISPECIES: DDE-type integrase/transposase/recombinase [unclassified Mycolicibacterium]|uniref:DDE-type integrase/transposase/recombinase n=1 Tax=unclassified Mycolicibacterium TaxID=2636767 RepID=UPI00192E3E93|nr:MULTISPECIES: DDE-type integrase/transposase/recombinase [unclassified Mycolicibacterium]
MTAAIELTLGSQVWFDGDVWTVTEFTPGGVTLSSGQSIRTATVAGLAQHAQPLTEPSYTPAEDRELVPVVLSMLDAAALAELEHRADAVRWILDQPCPRKGDRGRAIEHKAAELSVSTKTLRRWIQNYVESGVAGLADSKLTRKRAPQVDPRWDATLRQVLRSFTNASTPTRGAVIDATHRAVKAEYGDAVALPSRSAAYRRIDANSKGLYTFGSAKARRSAAGRPAGPYGRLRATRPGEYIVLDTTPLDVFAMEPVTLRWVPVELTVAMDIYTRCVLGLRLMPISTKSQDVANVLFQCVTQQFGVGDNDEFVWPFHGVPKNVLVGFEDVNAVADGAPAQSPGLVPETIVVDHGRQYLSAHVIGVCARFGISVQPAIPNKPTDKPTIERFFRTLRQSLLQHLPAYKGPDIYSRGKDIEGEAFYYVGELEQIIREWVGSAYHRTKHRGLCVPELGPGNFSPAEMWEIGLARSGALTLPARRDLTYEFLDVEWRTIQPYGVEINGRVYDGEGLNGFRGCRSPYGGKHAGRWPFGIDSHDVRLIHFRNPDTNEWHRLDWDHAAALHAPFSQDAADYAKTVSIRENRHIDPAQAVHDLLEQWSRDAVISRRDRALAKRIAATRAENAHVRDERTSDDDERMAASVPAVIDLVARRHQTTDNVIDDLDDVFERYYAENPDEEAFEVFSE